jgi:hypothetical protein
MTRSRRMSTVLFDAAELEGRIKMRFCSVHAEDQSMKKLLRTIEKMNIEKPLYED